MATKAVETEQDRRIGGLIGQMEAERRMPKPSRPEIDAFWKDPELGLFGNLAWVFPRFMYFNHGDWSALANDSPYRSLHKAFEDSYRRLVPAIAAQIKEKGIGEVFSKGPSPEVDKLLLEELVKNGTAVTYSPVDINPEAVAKVLNAATVHLDSKFGNSWRRFITPGENRAMSFNEARGKGKSCVIYSGGDLMNGIAMWEDARKTARKGGIVVANAAVNPDFSDWSSYWLGLYDNPQDKAMFLNGLKVALPDLFSERNKGKWSLRFSYLPENWDWAGRWGIYQTPAIVAQLDVREEMAVNTQDPVSGSLVELALKPRKKAEPPIALGISTKLNIADFLQTVPENFGLKRISYLTEQISHEEGGRHGLAAAAIFDVGETPARYVPARDLAPKMLRA